MAFIIAACVSLLMLLVFEFHHKKNMSAIFKVITSCLLLSYAVSLLLLETDAYALLIVSAIALGVLGDIGLIIRHKAGFIAGMIAFLIGHLVYLLAFTQLNFQLHEWAISFALLLFIGSHFFRYLLPSIEGSLKYGVAAYAITLVAMTSLALSVKIDNTTTVIGVGATLFLVSDIFVAMNRFKKSEFKNRLIGLPLYYAGQFTLATSIIYLQTDVYWLPV